MEHIEVTACKFLLEQKYRTLPIDLTEMDMDGVHIGTYNQWESLIATYEKEEYAAGHKGFTLSTKYGVYILHKNDLSHAECNIVIAHELGHILLKHITTNDIIGYSENASENNRQEEEANLFAEAVLAPLPVLSRLRIRNPRTIERLTGFDSRRTKVLAADATEKHHAPPHASKIQLADQFAASIPRQILKKRFVTICIAMILMVLSIIFGIIL